MPRVCDKVPSMARRIAVIEDEPAIRDNLRDALARQGFEVSTFGNRPEAQQAMQIRLPDMAIIDIGLGDEPDGGFELCRWLRENPADNPNAGDLPIWSCMDRTAAANLAVTLERLSGGAEIPQ